MDLIKVKVDGKNKDVEMLSLYKSFVGYEKKKYEENPTVGVLVNGKLEPLSERVDGKEDIQENPDHAAFLCILPDLSREGFDHRAQPWRRILFLLPR